MAGMLIFLYDAHRLSKQINHPLNKLCQDMDAVSKLQFKQAQLPPSNVYEINVIKKSFVQMKHGLQSFGKFLDKKVVLEMMKAGKEAELSVDRTKTTIFFCNISNITRYI